MKTPRRRAREFALQALYQWQLTEQSFPLLNNQFSAAEGFDKVDAELFRALLKGVIDQKDSLIELLQPQLDRPWAEVSPVERAVVLLGAYELREMPVTPYRVIINEAIELAKSFGGTDGHKYVNGVLDKLVAQLRADEIAYAAGEPKPRAAKAAKQPVQAVKVATKITRKVTKPSE